MHEGLKPGRSSEDFEYARGEAWLDQFRDPALPVSRRTCVFAALDYAHFGQQEGLRSGSVYRSKALLGNTANGALLTVDIDPSTAYVLDVTHYEGAIEEFEDAQAVLDAIETVTADPSAISKKEVAHRLVLGNNLAANQEFAEMTLEGASVSARAYWLSAMRLDLFLEKYEFEPHGFTGFSWKLKPNVTHDGLSPEVYYVPEILVPTDKDDAIDMARIKHIASSLIRNAEAEV